MARALRLAAVLLLASCRSAPDEGYYEAPAVPIRGSTVGTAPDAGRGAATAGASADTMEAPTGASDALLAEPTPDDAVVAGVANDDLGEAAGPMSAPASDPGPDDRLPSFAGLFERLSPSVVNIYTQEVLRQRLVDPRFGPMERDVVGTSLGSGMILDAAGFVLTNAHVVENAAEIRVRLHDEREMPASLVGIDPVRDLALLKLDDVAGLPAVEPGDSDALRVGDWVLAIGNPFGLSHTLTKGIVSAKDRSEIRGPDDGYADLIQTDAAVNRGNSGGPLFDLEGRVIGINTAINAEGQGIAFAIPWTVVSDALPRLKQGGQVSRSWLGVYVSSRGRGSDACVLVDAVVEDSPAMRGGMRPGDCVVELDEHTVRNVPEFRLQVAAGVAGRDLPVRVRRGRAVEVLNVRLEEARTP